MTRKECITMKNKQSIQFILLLLLSPALFAAQTVTYFINDLYGSPVTATDQHGAIIWQSQQYKPYGERIKDSNNDQQNDVWFTGKEEVRDTGLIYMNARYYDTISGRFLSPDPISPLEYMSGDNKNIYGFNLYQYANNNPYKYTDPNGKWADAVIDFGSAYIGYTNALSDFRAGNYWGAAANFAAGTFDMGMALIPGVAVGASAWYAAGTLTTDTISNSVRYGPMNPGPLPDDIADTFRSSSYTGITLSVNTTLYRVYGGSAGPIGSYWTRTMPAGPLQSQLDSALAPQWGNTATGISTIQVPSGTTIYEGFAAPQSTGVGSILGGGSQVYIPNVDTNWLR